MTEKPKIAIIGGSGLYEMEEFIKLDSKKISTPYGAPSSTIELGTLSSIPVAFLARHGKGHIYPAHKVNYRANIYALKEIGIERIIAVQTVGSLKEEFRPGELVIPDQFIDFTKKRDYSFYDGGRTTHVSVADPFCETLRELVYDTGTKLNYKLHSHGTYVCIEGPRFSTRAESKMFRNYADIIGMTLVPEAVLARELELCYVTIAQITDYDVWQEKPVDAHEIVRTMTENIAKIKEILKNVVPKIPVERNCLCPKALEFAQL